MKITVDAKNLKDIINAYFGHGMTRGSSKTSTRLAWDLAFIESKLTGKPVDYEVVFASVKINDLEETN